MGKLVAFMFFVMICMWSAFLVKIHRSKSCTEYSSTNTLVNVPDTNITNDFTIHYYTNKNESEINTNQYYINAGSGSGVLLGFRVPGSWFNRSNNESVNLISSNTLISPNKTSFVWYKKVSIQTNQNNETKTFNEVVSISRYKIYDLGNANSNINMNAMFFINPNTNNIVVEYGDHPSDKISTLWTDLVCHTELSGDVFSSIYTNRITLVRVYSNNCVNTVWGGKHLRLNLGGKLINEYEENRK